MPDQYKIHTWICHCGYIQDYNPNSQQHLDIFPNIKKGFCPQCKKPDLEREKKSSKQITVTVASDEELINRNNSLPLEKKLNKAELNKLLDKAKQNRIKYSSKEWKA